MGYGRFFLARGDDIDWDWAYLSSQGLHIDYFKFKLLPQSKRKKLNTIADIMAKEKVKLLEKIGPGAAGLI
jgi:hypothetical protein